MTSTASEHPSFSAFKAWLGTNSYAHYLNFGSRAGADYDAELWFDQEFNRRGGVEATAAA
jgi:hypothetical protein